MRKRSTVLPANVLELEYTLIPHGLHVVGESAPNAEQRAVDAATPRGGERMRGRSGARASTRSAGSTDPRDPGSSLHALDGGYRAACTGRRSAAHHRRPADRAQPAWLRSVPHSERLRRARRRAAGRAAAGAAPRGQRRTAGDRRHRAVGHRQSEDRGRPDRAGAVADRRRAALRQLWAPRRRAPAAARDIGSAAHRCRCHAVGHLPRPAAVANETACRGGASGGRRGRTGRTATSSASTRWTSRRRTAAASKTRRCACSATPTVPMAPTSITSSATAPGTTKTNWPRRSCGARALPMAHRARRGGTMRCCSTCWRTSMSPIRTSIRSNSA